MTIVHQNHPMGPSHQIRRNLVDKLWIINTANYPDKSKEHVINLYFAGGYGHCYDILDADYVTKSDLTLIKRPFQWASLGKKAKRFLQLIRDKIRFSFMNLSTNAQIGGWQKEY